MSANPQGKATIEVELIDHMGNDTSIARAAWISTGPDEREKDTGRIEGLIRYLMRHRHGTPFEHATATFRVHAPIMVFREWQRHRIQSYNEQSGRYTQFEPVFYLPDPDRPLVNVGTSARPEMGMDKGILAPTYELLRTSYTDSWDKYQQLLELGVANEIARLVLPVGTYSSMYATANLRGWLHFLGLRTSPEHATVQGHPQWEIVKAAEQVEEILKKHFPITMEMWDSLGRVAP